MSRWHRVFCSCTCVKVLLTDTFLKCRFRWKVEIISTFPLRTNVVFFLNQSFLSIHVNKLSHIITSLIQSPQYHLKVKLLFVNKFNMILDNKDRLVLNDQSTTSPHNEPQRSPGFFSSKFRKFHRKTLCLSLFLTTLQVFRRYSNTDVFLRNFSEHLFWRISAKDCFYLFHRKIL